MENQEAKTCLNCKTPLQGEYCYVCGQKDIPPRLSWKELRNDLFSKLFGFERGFLKTFIDLTLRPGEMGRNYLAGHRKPYQSPIQYYLIGTTLIFLLYNYFHFIEHLQDGSFNAQLQGIDKVDESSKKVLNIMAPWFQNLRVLIAFMPPFVALIFKWFYSKKTGYSYLEHLVFTVFTVAHTSFLSLPVLPSMAFFGNMGAFISALVSFFYMFWAVKHFYKTSWLKAFFSYILGYMFFMLFFMISMIVYVIIYIVMKGGV